MSEDVSIIQSLGKWLCYYNQLPYCGVFRSLATKILSFISPSLLLNSNIGLTFLAEFSLDIQYWPDPQNILPDALSRIVLAPPASGNDPSPGGDVGMYIHTGT